MSPPHGSSIITIICKSKLLSPFLISAAEERQGRKKRCPELPFPKIQGESKKEMFQVLFILNFSGIPQDWRKWGEADGDVERLLGLN